MQGPHHTLILILFAMLCTSFQEDKEWDFVHVFTDIKSELAALEPKTDDNETGETLDNPMAAI